MKPLKRLLPSNSRKPYRSNYKQEMVLKNQMFQQQKIDMRKQLATELFQKENEKKVQLLQTNDEKMELKVEAVKKPIVKTSFFGILGDIDDSVSSDND